MAVYDDQDTKTRVDDDELRKITGISDGKENTIPDGATAEDSEKESLGVGTSDDGNKNSKGKKGSEDEATPDDPDSPGYYRDEDGGGRFRLTKKQGIVGGIAGLLVAGGFGVTSFLQGPLQAIHKAQLLSGFHFTSSEIFHDDRSAKFFLYSLSGKAAKGRLGFINNSVADKIELRLNNDAGIRSIYHPTTGRLMAYQILDPVKASSFLDELEADGITKSSSLPIEGTDINGGGDLDGNKEFIDLNDSRLKHRRSVTRFATKSTELNSVTSKLASRLLIKRAGVNFHPLKPGRRAADDFFTWRKGIQDEKAREHATGDPADFESPDFDGPDPGEPLPGSARSRVVTKLRSLLNAAKGPLIAVGTFCAIDSFSNSIDDQNYENLQQVKRLGMDAVTVGHQVMSNQDVNMEVLGALNELNYDPETDTTWASDAGILAEQGKTGGVNYVEDVKPGTADKPLFFDAIDAVPQPSFSGYTPCKAYEDVSGLVSKIPGYNEFMGAMESGINTALSAANIPSVEELQQNAIEYFAEGGVDLLARGAERGGLENKGVRAAAIDNFIAIGGREFSGSETIEAKAEANAELAYRQSQQGIYDRYVNPYNATSAFGSMLTGAKLDLAGVINSLIKLPSSLASVFSGSYTNKVAAQVSYDYGFPLYGFSEEELNSDIAQDPYANGEWIETDNRLEELNEEYGEECFGMTISSNGDLVYGEAVDPSKIPDKCSDTTNESLLRYRFYLADMVNAKSIACYEGVDESACSELGFGSSGVTGQINTGASSEYIPDCTVNDGNAKIACVAIDTMLGIPYKNGYSTRENCNQWPAPSNAENPVSALDCSAFTSMAVYRAFGTDAPRSSVAYLVNSNFEVVGDTRSGTDKGNIGDIQPGDLVGRGDCASGEGGSCNGHIGIVVSYNPTTRELVTVETDSCGKDSRIVTDKGLAADGNGTYTWAVRYIGPKDSAAGN